MALKIAESCSHDISDQDVAAHVDGLCPLCLKAERDALVKALQEIADLGAKGETSARLGNIAHAALISVGQVRTP